MVPEHCVVGAAFSHLGLHQRYGTPVTLVMIIASALPDVDGVLLLFGLQSFFDLHRTVTHSVTGILVLSAGLALLAPALPSLWLRSRHRLGGEDGKMKEAGTFLGLEGAHVDTFARRGLLFGAALLAMTAHILTDALYPWAVGLLWPFKHTGYCWPVLNWGDWGILAIAVFGMFALGLAARRRRLMAAGTLLLFAAYTAARYLFFGWTG